MADTKLTDLTALTAVAAGDLFYVVDISDTTDDAAGTSKKITQANLVGAFANTFVVGQTIAPAAATGSPAPALLVTGAAHTALTASTENIGINLNQSATKEFATGALTTQREVLIQAPTYSVVGASTIATAATLAITGPPIAGTNATITNPYTLMLQDGKLAIRDGSTRSVNIEYYDAGGALQFTDSNGGGTISIIPANSSISGFTYVGGLTDIVPYEGGGLGTLRIGRRSDASSAVGASVHIWTYTGQTDDGLQVLSPGGASKLFSVSNQTDSGTNTITDAVKVFRDSTGTPAAGLGSAILFNIDSSTTADQAAGRLSFSWATATHASRLSKAAISVYDVSTSRDAIVCEAISGGIENTLYGVQKIRQVGGTPGTDEVQISHDGTDGHISNVAGNLYINQRADGGGAIWLSRIGYDNGQSGIRFTPVSTGSSETISAYFSNSLVSLILRGSVIQFNNGSVAASLAPSASNVLKVTDGSTGYGSLVLGTTDSGTNTITDSLTIGRDSSGTPAAGLGSAILFNIDSSTTADQNAARLQSSWTVATHASRTSEVGIKTVTNAGSLTEVARFDGGGGASPSAGNTGFMLFDVDNGTLERVTVGAADSGGTGYKVLRIPN